MTSNDDRARLSEPSLVASAGRWPWPRYRGDPSAYNELFDPSGEPREDWKRLVEKFGAMGLDELRRRWDDARRLLHEHGVSYDVYGDPDGVDRPWNLSPIPVVFGSATWDRLASGLGQRARLLDRVLGDLYGPQRLVSEGLLPPEIIFGHAGFLRACAGVVPAGGHYLPFYSGDVVRDREGRFAVLADRTQAPSGVGYALENRIVSSRSLPEIFQDCGVQRLAAFFRATRNLLRQLSPGGGDSPRIVLLTPGPYSATYFEQAFLAQYLALTLVRGEDLVVRETRVYLKTLGGLKRVDVILRRVNDDFCDPLELRPDSFLGVPGLVEAARAGTVAIVNPLGTGILQTPTFLPFLPALCRRLLDEDLELASVPTYWCGDPEARAYVESNFDDLVIKPAFPSGPTEPVFARTLTREGLDDLRARIRARPHRFVAQECVTLSTVPTLSGDDVVPGHLWMRVYGVRSARGGPDGEADADAHHGYKIMPGALSRVGGPGESLALSLRPGGESKDTWVLAGETTVPALSLLPSPTAPVELSRDESDLPSRVADNLFWLGRYAERAEGTARLARAVAGRLADLSTSDADRVGDVDHLLRMLESQTYVRRQLTRGAGGSNGSSERSLERWLLGAVFDAQPFGTLRGTVSGTHRVARSLRDWISGDAWRTVVHLDQELRRPSVALDFKTGNALRALVDHLNRVVSLLAALQGLITESMTHDQGWRFLDIGRRLERSAHSIGLLRSALGTASTREGPVLEALLETAASTTTYRRRYLATLQAAPVVDLLLCDETNPRSVLFQLATLSDHMDALPRSVQTPRTPQQKLVLSALTELRLADVSDVCEPGLDRYRGRLVALLDRVGAHLPALSNSVSAAYFNHAVPLT